MATFKLYRFLTTFAKLRKVTVSFVMTVSTSFRQNETTRLPVYGLKFDTSIFRKSIEKVYVSLKSDKRNGHFTWRPICILIISRSLLLRMKKIFHTKFIKKTKNLCWIIVFRKSCRLWDNVRKYCRVGRTTDDNMAHAHFMQDTRGYKYTFGICNSYCFSIVIMIALTRLIVTLYLPCLSFWQK